MSKIRRTTPTMLALEPRFMFDAAGVVTAAEVAFDPAPQPGDGPAAHDPATEQMLASLAEQESPATASTNGRDEIVFVDTSVRDYQSIVASIDARAQIVLIDPSRDGVEQIREALAGREGIDAIHIISHGSEGKLSLGDGSLHAGNLGAYSSSLAEIGTTLAEDGDILLWGCDVGAGEKGAAFLTALSGATGADIAASNDATGAASRGGNWTLETSVGEVLPGGVITADSMSGYSALLAAGTIDFHIVNPPPIGEELGDVVTDGMGGSSDIAGITYQIFGANADGTANGSTWYYEDDISGEGHDGIWSDASYGDPAVVIRSADGSEFSFNGIRFFDYIGAQSQVKVEGFRDGVSTGSLVLDLTSYAGYLHVGSFAGLSSAVFGNVDEIRLTNPNDLPAEYGAPPGTKAMLLAIDDIVVGDVSAPPAAPSTPDLAAASDTGASSTDNITNDTTPTFTGTAVAGATVTLFNDANNNGSIDAGELLATGIATGGAWSITPGALAAGTYNVRAIASNADGSSAASAGLSITIDTTAPAAPSAPDLVASSDTGNSDTDNVTEDTTPTFSGTGAPANGPVYLYANGVQVGSATADAAGEWNVTVVSGMALDPGEYYFVVRTQDAAGNLSAASSAVPVTINSAPTASANMSQTVSYTEDPAGSVALGDIVVTEYDPGDPITATLTLSDVNAGTLTTGTYGSATSTFNSGTGVWTVTGSVANVNAALAAVAFTPSAHWDQNVTITTRIRDANGSGPADGTISLNVTPVADAPTATNMNQSKTVTEGDSAIALDDVVVTDVDTDDVITATLTLSDPLAAYLSSGAFGSTQSVFNAITGEWSVTGSVADVNAALAAVTLTLADDYTQNFTITTRIRDDNGTGPADGTISVTVTAVNDAPTVTAPGSILVTEDVATALTGISFSDIDADANAVTVTLSVPSGSLAATSGGGVTVGGTTSALTLTGSIADINSFIAGSNVSFTTAANSTSNVTLTVTINDNGNTGSGGAQEDSTSVTLNVTAVNDAPSVTTPASIGIVMNEAGALTGISFADVDAGGSSVTVTLSVPSGSLTATSGAGVTVSGTASALTLSGTIADINAFIAAGEVSFTTALDSSASVTLTVGINDSGNTGAGGAQQDSTTVTLVPSERPVISTGGGSVSYIEDGSAAVVAPNLALTDGDSANMQGATVTVTDYVTGDLLNFTDQNGIVGSYDAAIGVLTLTGTATKAQYQAALRSFTFSSTSDNPATGAGNGNRVIEFRVNDGTLQSVAGVTQTVTVSNANDAPELDDSASPALTGVSEDASAPVNGSTAGSTLVSALTGGTWDVDSGALQGVAIVGVSNAGTLWYSTDGATTWLQAPAVSESDALLLQDNARIYFQPAADVNGTISDAITFHAWDRTTGSNGGTADVSARGGSTAFSTASVAASVSIAPVNDAPTISASPVLSASEDTVLTITGAELNFADVDTGDSLQSITITSLATEGTLFLDANNNGVLDGGEAITAGQTITVADIDAGRLKYIGAADGEGAGYASFEYTASDGSASSAAATATINVSAVNDAPGIVAPGFIAVSEDMAAIVTGISFTDVDSETGDVTVTLSVPSGSLEATTGGGVTVGGTSSALTLSGTVADINAFIAGLNVIYTPAANVTGDVTLTVAINDNGNSGSGGAQQDSTTVTLDIIAVNDAPTVVAPGSIAVRMNEPGALTGISFADVDAGSSSVTVTLSVPSGSLTATSGAGVTVGGTASARTLTGTIADINAFIAAAEVSFTTALDTSADVTLTVSIDDNGNTGTGGAQQDSTTVTLVPSERPVVSIGAGTTSYDEDGAAVVVAPSLSITDGDSPDMQGATVTVTDFVTGDLLNFVNQNGIIGSYDAVTGVLTLAGTATRAQYEAALRSVTFSSASDNPATGPGNASRVIEFSVNDGSLESAGSVKTIAVANTNDAPELDASASASLAGIAEDAPAPVNGSTAGSTLVSSLTGAISDVDADAEQGVAIVGVSNAGTLWYSIDGGTTWTQAPALSASNALLLHSDARIYFQPAANVNGVVSIAITFHAWDRTTGANGGTADVSVRGGSTAFSSASDTASVSVMSVNDAPTITAGPVVSATEDTVLTITAGDLNFADVDTGDALQSITITSLATQGTLFLDANSNGELDAGEAITTGQIIAVADIDAGRLKYIGAQDGAGTGYASFQYTVSDGSASSLAATATIDVAGVNDAPSIVAPGVISVSEDTASALTGISFTDVDSGANAVTVTLSVPSGSLAATSAAGVTVGGTSSALTLTGTIADINAFIAASNVSFTTAADAINAVTLAVEINDNGNSGSGSPQQDSITITLNVTAVNDAPVVTAPVAIGVRVNEPEALTGISFADTDAAGSVVTVTFSVPSGSVTAASGAGVTVGGTASALTLTGTIADINAFIAAAEVSFTTALDASANVTLTVTINDNGNTGSGGAQQDSATVTLTTSERPVVWIGAGTSSYVEDGAGAIVAPNLTLTDSDSANMQSATVTVTDFVAGDLLNFTDQNGITGSYNAATGVLTLNGTATRAQYQTALRSITFSSTSENPGTGAGNADRVIEFRVSDGTLQSVAGVTQTVAVSNANDAPVLNDSGFLSLSGTIEDAAAPVNGSTAGSTLVSSLTGGITDVDTGALQGVAIVGVSDAGTLWYSTDGGTTWSQAPALSASNALLLQSDARIYFQPGANVNGVISDAITFHAWDRTTGANGGTADVTARGGATAFSTATDTASVSVTAVNDAPTIAVQGTIQIAEDVATALSALQVNDLDDSAVTVTLSVTAGTLSAASSDSVVVVGSGTVVALTGPVDAINAFISGGGVIYTAEANSTADQTLSVTVSDGELSATTDVTLEVVAVNDAPVATGVTVPDIYGRVGSELSVTLPDGLFSDVDTGDTLTLSVQNLPMGLVFDPATRTISGKPLGGVSSTRPVTITASDSAGASASITVRMSIAPPLPPVGLPSIPPVIVPVFVPEISLPTPLSGSLSGLSPTAVQPISSFDAPTLSPLAASGVVALQSAGAARAGTADIFVASPPRNVVIPTNSRGEGGATFTLPADMFVATGARSVSVSVSLADGEPLPPWVVFDPVTGTFIVNPPEGYSGTIVLRVTAETDTGRTAVSEFEITVGGEESADAEAAPSGKPSLSEQLRAAARDRGLADVEQLIASVGATGESAG